MTEEEKVKKALASMKSNYYQHNFKQMGSKVLDSNFYFKLGELVDDLHSGYK